MRLVINFCDFALAFIGLITCFPLILILVILILLEDFGNPVFVQARVGKDNEVFNIYKLRSMRLNQSGPLLSTANDPRITTIGKFIRKYKLDETPQLINVLLGQMSFVGPRPEVEKYVSLYTIDQKKVLSVKPGITDYASIVFRNENYLLELSSDPELTYINTIVPRKIRLNMLWVNNYSIFTYFHCIFKTIQLLLFK